MKPLTAIAGIALLIAVLVVPAAADIALLDTGTSPNNMLHLYNNDGTPKNVFGGGTTNQYSQTGTIVDVACLSTGQTALVFSVQAKVQVLNANGTVGPSYNLPGGTGYGERICSMPDGGFAVATWFTNTSRLLFYDYDANTQTWSVGANVDVYAATAGHTQFNQTNTDISLAGGQLTDATPDVAVIGNDANNVESALFFDRNGAVAGTTVTKTLISGDPWISGTPGVTADPVGGAADSAVVGVYQWPKTTDFGLYTQPNTETKISDGVSQTSPQAEAWVDVAVDPDDTSRLLALSSTGSVYQGVYPVTLSGTTATVGGQLIPFPTGVSRIDATLPVAEPEAALIPEPAAGLLGLGLVGLAARRRRRK